MKLEYVLADAARFRATVQPSEQQIQARFEAKKDAYKVPEKRVVSYVLLDREVLRPQAVVTDRDIELYYQDHREDFRQEEEACARHILVKVKQGDAAEGHTDAGGAADRRRAARAGERGRRLRGDRQEVLRGPGLRAERGRPGLLPAGPDGARVRRRGLRAAAGRDLAAREELLRLPHHPPRLEARIDGAGARTGEGAHPCDGPRAQDGRARRREGAGRQRRADARQVARGSRQGAGPERPQEQRLRPRRDACASSPRPCSSRASSR